MPGFEDDYDSEFRYAGRPLPALQGMDGDDRVIYVGTFSKVLFPAIQIGYIVAPRALVPAFVAARSLNGHASATLDQAILCDFMTKGHFVRHLRRMRVIYAKRQRALVAAAHRELDRVLDVRASDAGMHLMGWLPPGVDDTAACHAAAGQGVEVTPLSAYSLPSHRHNRPCGLVHRRFPAPDLGSHAPPGDSAGAPETTTSNGITIPIRFAAQLPRLRFSRSFR